MFFDKISLWKILELGIAMDIREEFLKFFESKEHKVVPSSPLVPEDATLLVYKCWDGSF